MNRQEAIALSPGNVAQLAWVDEIFAARPQDSRKGTSRGTGWRLPMARISRFGKPPAR